MQVTRIPINSHSDPNRIEPWYDLSDDGTGITINAAKQGGLNLASLVGSKRPLHSEISQVAAQHPTAAIIEIAIKLDGTLSVHPAGTYPFLAAHLGWYDVASDTLKLLQFVDTPITPVTA